MDRISGWRGRYPIKFSGARFRIPEQMKTKIAEYGVRGFRAYPDKDTVVGIDYDCFVLVPQAEGNVDCPIINGKIRVPKHIRDALGIEKEGYLFLVWESIELWGSPDVESYLKQEKNLRLDDVTTPELENIL